MSDLVGRDCELTDNTVKVTNQNYTRIHTGPTLTKKLEISLKTLEILHNIYEFQLGCSGISQFFFEKRAKPL